MASITLASKAETKIEYQHVDSAVAAAAATKMELYGGKGTKAPAQCWHLPSRRSQHSLALWPGLQVRGVWEH